MQFEPRRARCEKERPTPVGIAAGRDGQRRLIDDGNDDIAAKYIELRAAGATIAIG